MNEKIHSYVQCITVIILLVSLTSCTMHAEFPFICFRSGCVSDDFNLKPFKKRLQGQLNAQKRKRNAKRNTIARTTPKSSPDDTVKTNGASVQYHKYLLYFYSDTVVQLYDSVLVTHSSAHNRLLDAGESAIEHLLRIKGVNNFFLVTFRPVRHDQADVTDTQSAAFDRIKSIRHFLHLNGIPYSRIRYRETNLK